ncbi:MAG: DUF3293 domain-containing protein [Thermomonas sp.]|uniref:DUF3293 domain-containing protein n=1 Tax=Thermomonas sp. TaxID=1971895 RepID=UPI0026277EC0|nr:DUF3293 domain-containing protein [Thermomonas sp.]MCC7096124.1 DUF3293 domain-containing protein [Thermomonas sp.]
MIPATHAGNLAQPRFHGEALLLPVADGSDWPQAPVLEFAGTRLLRKSELHVTLLGRTHASALRERLDDARIHRIATGFDWTVKRTGAGSVLAKLKHDGTAPLPCTSLVERIDMPAFTAFRDALATIAGLSLPDTCPHVTLYVAGDPEGIGLPDSATFAALRQFDLPLPTANERSPPPLPEALRNAYLAARYRIPPLGCSLHIGMPCPELDGELARHGARHASILTAHNPCSVQLPPAANVLRQQLMHAELEALGITTIIAESHDPEGHWPSEPGLLAIDTPPDVDDTLLIRYRQHALVALELGQPARLVLHPAHRAPVVSPPLRDR